MKSERRIEPWRKTIPLPDLLHLRFSNAEVKGTEVHYDGLTLRSKGGYTTDDARALLASMKHMTAEGFA